MLLLLVVWYRNIFVVEYLLSLFDIDIIVILVVGVIVFGFNWSGIKVNDKVLNEDVVIINVLFVVYKEKML